MAGKSQRKTLALCKCPRCLRVLKGRGAKSVAKEDNRARSERLNKPRK